MCTSFRTLPAADGTVVVGRSMEFPDLIPWKLGVVPAGIERTAEIGTNPKTWTPKYPVVGVCAFGDAQKLADGMNNAGLSAHGLYMPGGFCTYQKPKGDGSDVATMDLISYLLGTCASIAEVKAAMAKLTVVGVDPGMGFPPPMHYLIYSESEAIAIEFRADGVSVVDNPVAVGTNAPYLDWHLTNLRNYVGLSSTNPEATIDGEEWTPLGQGQGVRGIPGDYTPPARFVRAFANTRLAEPASDSDGAERLTLHILNSLDIVPGVIREPGPNGTERQEITDWVSVSNLSKKRYGYRSFADPSAYVVDLESADLSTERTVEMPAPAGFSPSPL